MGRYTLLLSTAGGVVLHEYHRRRLVADDGPAEAAAFARFARDAAPGVHAVWMDAGGALRAEPREGSRLFDGMPVRFAVSPVAGERGTVPKPAPPGPYDAFRIAGTATLLTSADGAEILEACVAAVLSWDGGRIVCVPPDRPRVWSTAETAVREHLSVRCASIPAVGPAPLLLLNAVKGTCAVSAPGRAPFPEKLRQEVDELFARLTGRPG